MLVSLFLSACMAEGTGSDQPASPDAGTSTSAIGPYCEVQAKVFSARCTNCHRPQGQVPDLSFEGAKSSIVGVESTLFAHNTFVVAGDATSSFLYKKVAGMQAAHEGALMPLGSTLSAEELTVLQNWIDDGASFECTDQLPATDGGVARYHPEGFADRDVHGTEMKLQLQDCRTCHGDELTGGLGPSCDSCHTVTEWRTTCTFCHGGTDTMTGAPPRDLSSEIARELLTFRAHTEHTTVRNHQPYDCTQCHKKPEHVLSANHAFDDTPGRAEVDFSGGLSAIGNYLGEGSCANLYCHGNGRTTGAYQHTNPRPDCDNCHAGPNAGEARWETMSGHHDDHLKEDLECTDCHGEVVDGANTIFAPELHVNGVKNLRLPQGMTRNGATCSGTCHGEDHDAERW